MLCPVRNSVQEGAEPDEKCLGSENNHLFQGRRPSLPQQELLRQDTPASQHLRERRAHKKSFKHGGRVEPNSPLKNLHKVKTQVDPMIKHGLLDEITFKCVRIPAIKILKLKKPR